MTDTKLDRQISSVVRNGNCTGCGACCLLDAGLQMELNQNGYYRPIRVAPAAAGALDAKFDRICPGVEVQAQRPAGAVRHRLLGSSFGNWQAWAKDDAIRIQGSSGGTITAIVSWLLESNQITEVVAASTDPDQPRRTVPITLTTSREALAAAGSRYAPVPNAVMAVLGRPDVAFVGKPCEVSAVRALAQETGKAAPLLISFFCAGTPSQWATDSLVERLSGTGTIADLWYRGHGWPGEFTVIGIDGTRTTESYDHSWGKELGPTVQWRCKICPDAVGESADIVAADYWETDEDGYPSFVERDGVSALIARTARGLGVINQAFAEQAVAGSSLDLDDLAAVQPLQTERRETILARAAGALLAGRRVTRFKGFGFWRITRGRPRKLLRVIRGSRRRARGNRTDV